MIKANNTQKAKIHIAKSELKLSRENYEAILSGFKDKNGDAITSSKDLSYKQAEELLEVLRKLGWKAKKASRQSSVGSLPDRQAGRQKKQKAFIKIEVPENRPAEFAEVKQLKMLAAIWIDNSREKDEKSFNNFICRIAKVSHYSFLQKEDVKKVKAAIEELKEGNTRVKKLLSSTRVVK